MIALDPSLNRPERRSRNVSRRALICPVAAIGSRRFVEAQWLIASMPSRFALSR
jgi:hypothetical protein